jgi:aryl-alcohol dehydrogenase-like predicted oxidoreductase
MCPDSFRKTNPRFAKEAFDHNMKLVNEIKAVGGALPALALSFVLTHRSSKQVAEKKGCTPGQISLAWVLAQGENVIPIPVRSSLRRNLVV